MPKPAFDDKAKAAFIEAIESGSGGRLDSARAIEVDLAVIDAAIENDPAFRKRLELAESVKVRDALMEAASSGNVPAIESFLRRTVPAEPPARAPHGAIADVLRLAGEMSQLLIAKD